MRKTWTEIKNETMSPKDQARAHALAMRNVADLELRELRKVLKLTQGELAKKLKIRQVAVSRLEGRRNVLVETLGEYIAGLGGELEIRAVFPNRTVRLTNFVRRQLTGGHVGSTGKRARRVKMSRSKRSAKGRAVARP
jgi:transcriptional regulator with XRE-family HTH domain